MMVTATSDPVRLPPGPRLPKVMQTATFLISNHAMFAAVSRRYGSDVVRVNLPRNNHAVVVNDPVLAKELFNAGTELVERPSSGAGSIGEAFGSGSTFSLAGDEHRERRRLLAPPFHGKRMRSYDRIIEEEVMREVADWPEGREFETLEPMLRITVGAILRAVFGAEGPALEELRETVPAMVTLGSLLVVCPPIMRRDLGPWSPWARYMKKRRRFDAVIASLIAEARADPAIEERKDVLALLLQARYENGEPISDQHIADELLTLLGSGHETTASSLAWALERLSRQPELLDRLTEEVDAGGSELRQATISEVQRTRPVLDGTTRRTKTRIRLGDWVLPQSTNIIISIKLAHDSEESFPDAASFNPDRYMGTNRKPVAWIPFGGGVNRCVGAAFANMESDVVLRILLREFRFVPTDAPGERARWRGVATVPARGARAMVHRRTDRPLNDVDSPSVVDHARA
jgi:cytochrome P450